MLLLLLLLSQICVTPERTAHQAPLSLGFSRQEHWSVLPFPSPVHGSESEITHSCRTLNYPMDCSLPGSSVHGIFQARVLEWGAIAFSIAPSKEAINIDIRLKFDLKILSILEIFSISLIEAF